MFSFISAATSNITIASIAVGICVARWLSFLLNFRLGAIEFLYDLALSTFWLLGLRGQSRVDTSDPIHVSPKPWYLEHSCGVVSGEARKNCVLMQAIWGFYLIAL